MGAMTSGNKLREVSIEQCLREIQVGTECCVMSVVLLFFYTVCDCNAFTIVFYYFTFVPHRV